MKGSNRVPRIAFGMPRPLSATVISIPVAFSEIETSIRPQPRINRFAGIQKEIRKCSLQFAVIEPSFEIAALVYRNWNLAKLWI